MRTNRPSGISQENRSHPFFILLRRFSEEQSKLAHDIMKRLITAGGVSIAPGLIMWSISPLDAISWFISILYVTLMGLNFIFTFRDLQRTLAKTVYSEVESMIYSDEYQYQSLNNEQLINMMNDCTRVNGELSAYKARIRTMIIHSMITAVIICIAMLIYRFS